MSSPWRARSAASRNSTTRSRQRAARATLVPLDLKDCRRHRPARRARIYERWGKLDMLLGNAGVLGAITPLVPSRPEGLGRRDGGQRHRQLAAHPLARSAAPPVRRRPGAVRDLRRRARSACPTGAPIRPRRRRSRRWSAPTPPSFAPDEREGQPAQSRPDCAPSMRAQAAPGEDPKTPAAAGGSRARHRPHAVAGLRRQRRALRFPDRRTSAPQRAAPVRRLARSASRSSPGRNGLSPFRSIRRIGIAGQVEVVAERVDEVARVGRRAAPPAASRTRRRSAAAPWSGSGSGA